MVKDCLEKAKALSTATNEGGRPSKFQIKMQNAWYKTAAYIGQVINSISKTYDVAQIQAELDELRKIVAEMTTSEHNKVET